MRISKRTMWIISESHREKNFFFDIFAIHSSSRHEKRCQMSLRLFSLFQGSIYKQCLGTYYWEQILSQKSFSCTFVIGLWFNSRHSFRIKNICYFLINKYITFIMYWEKAQVRNLVCEELSILYSFYTYLRFSEE